ncbi:hypothetical protein PTKIN_Ptkin12aG0043300 [Pterospermum kingtungense]
MEKKFMSLSWSLGVFVLIMMLVSKSKPVDAISCPEALISLQPCLPFLKGAASSPAIVCCEGVANVNAAASSTSARRDLCKCFKQTVPVVGVKPDRAKQLPQLCAVNVPVPIDPSVDCDSISL